MARETSKSILRRMHQPGFATKYFVGHGLDIGAGNDSLSQYAELFPLIESVSDWDVLHGDAQDLAQSGDEWFDFVHSSHCLEHLDDPSVALQNWIRVVKPGGYLVLMVPDEDLYEQGVWPSTKSLGHKHTFTIGKLSSWSPESINLLTLLALLSGRVEVIKIERLEHTYRHRVEPKTADQTQTPIGECAIEIILRKRPLTFGELWLRLQPISILGTDAARTLYDFAVSAPDGDTAEVGVYRGGSARLMASAAPGKILHLFDTFCGMPDADESRDQHKAGDFADTSLEAVQKNMVGLPNVAYYEGLFPETAAGLERARFSLVHVDCDLYRSVRDCCEWFYPRMVAGGVMVFDDYNHASTPGAKLAVDEFFADKPETVTCADWGQAWIVAAHGPDVEKEALIERLEYTRRNPVTEPGADA